MQSIWIIAGLTLKEVVRRRLFVLSLLVALLFFLASLMPTLFGAGDMVVQATGERQSVAVMLAVFFGLPMLKFFAGLEVIVLASGAISSEIERGLLAVILPKPLARWQLVVGKWLGINLLMVLNLIFWSGLGWFSLYCQTGHSYPTVVYAGLASIAYAVLFCTLALFFSTFAAAPLAAGLTLFCWAAAWPHAILRQLGATFQVPALTKAGAAARYLVPTNQIELWIERLLGPLMPAYLNPRGFAFAVPLGPTAGDLVYAAVYVTVFFCAALFVFQRRDVS
jgi:ABC-type transport system involved in multi-copper enzyme maturation permease subunit